MNIPAFQVPHIFRDQDDGQSEDFAQTVMYPASADLISSQVKRKQGLAT